MKYCVPSTSSGLRDWHKASPAVRIAIKSVRIGLRSRILPSAAAIDCARSHVPHDAKLHAQIVEALFRFDLGPLIAFEFSKLEHWRHTRIGEQIPGGSLPFVVQARINDRREAASGYLCVCRCR
jgi:hypothetical protein